MFNLKTVSAVLVSTPFFVFVLVMGVLVLVGMSDF